MLFVVRFAYSQDYIVKINGDTLFCKISKVNDSDIVFFQNGYKKSINNLDVKYFYSEKAINDSIKAINDSIKTTKENESDSITNLKKEIKFTTRNSQLYPNPLIVDTALSLQYNILKITKEINDINIRLNRHHKQFMTGFYAASLGVIISTIGVIAMKDSETGIKIFAFTGSAITLTGFAIMIDSDKWLRKK